MGNPPNKTLRAWIAVLSCPLLVYLTVVLVDRAASTWAHDHLHRPPVMDMLTHIVDPLRALSAIALAAVGAAALFRGWRPGAHGRTLIAASLAILVSVGIKELLKDFFGRTWPETWTNNNPSWIGDHVFGFHLLHGGVGWESFPSGHTTQMAALAAVIWLWLPRIRWLGVALCALVALGLWGSDYHYVGDIVAGAYLGASCGVGMVALVCRA